jgi:hypothetical protein
LRETTAERLHMRIEPFWARSYNHRVFSPTIFSFGHQIDSLPPTPDSLGRDSRESLDPSTKFRVASQLCARILHNS